MGFFSAGTVKGDKPASTLPMCGACGLSKSCRTPKMKVKGSGSRQILVVGGFPTLHEDRTGKPFLGESGDFMTRSLRSLGIDLWEDCWLTNSIICTPTETRAPSDKQIACCQPNLLNAIRDLKPKVILLLGNMAVTSFFTHFWKGHSVGKYSRWDAQLMPLVDLNAWVMIAHHPTYVMQQKDEMIQRLWLENLSRLEGLTDRPWEVPPDYREKIDVIHDDREAARLLRKMIKGGKPVAFDYETNCLRPELSNAKIKTASVCYNGRVTIAFPWYRHAITAMRELLRAPNPKIACNLKFEDRWTQKHLKTPVRNWWWDTMIAAHVIDNRASITSIKFQSLLHLGCPAYDNIIKPYLIGNPYNDIDRAPMQELLLYNGLDSFLEYEVATTQMEAFK